MKHQKFKALTQGTNDLFTRIHKSRLNIINL